MKGLRREPEIHWVSEHPLTEVTKFMAFLKEFRCEICGTVSSNPVHWFVIQCSNSQLTVLQWNLENANAPGARHYCGEGHAQVYISRWFKAACTPPLPDFKTLGASGKT